VNAIVILIVTAMYLYFAPDLLAISKFLVCTTIWRKDNDIFSLSVFTSRPTSLFLNAGCSMLCVCYITVASYMILLYVKLQ